jgi:hypothetical protein
VRWNWRYPPAVDAGPETGVQAPDRVSGKGPQFRKWVGRVAAIHQSRDSGLDDKLRSIKRFGRKSKEGNWAHQRKTNVARCRARVPSVIAYANGREAGLRYPSQINKAIIRKGWDSYQRVRRHPRQGELMSAADYARTRSARASRREIRASRLGVPASPGRGSKFRRLEGAPQPIPAPTPAPCHELAANPIAPGYLLY